MFDTHALTIGLEVATALAEHVTELPVAPEREGRNHDLLALGLAGGRKIVIGVEAKAAEPLGPEVGRTGVMPSRRTARWCPTGEASLRKRAAR